MTPAVCLEHATAEVTVRKAARALARAGLVGAYGHCSVRLSDQEMLVCASKAMGTILRTDVGTVVPIIGVLPEGVLGEVRVHQHIYRNRADVGAICRVFPRDVLNMSVLGEAPECRHGLSAFFHPRPAYWNDAQLMRTDELAAGVATTLGRGAGIILRGNGAVTAAATMQQAIALCVFLEDMCRIELSLRATGEAGRAPLLTTAEAIKRADWHGRVEQRMWDHLTFGDAE
ncbi:class II aldolase/adducin family protein [Variovorax guangxiensis]|uniref:class II aldolase/adducin family protein n=1 Tax=Variovorax guangxiensis TaxID=1775474 RepID=UPI0028598668|nr:class II aldolase/adducin family protein [Variovorax guangxiensis]MDR6858688.1 HCOMODA/2-hydroxy-3-carboxy-muconic semialdehyde decarboxylase [Variovorax guangxiensis]